MCDMQPDEECSMTPHPEFRHFYVQWYVSNSKMIRKETVKGKCPQWQYNLYKCFLPVYGSKWFFPHDKCFFHVWNWVERKMFVCVILILTTWGRHASLPPVLNRTRSIRRFFQKSFDKIYPRKKMSHVFRDGKNYLDFKNGSPGKQRSSMAPQGFCKYVHWWFEDLDTQNRMRSSSVQENKLWKSPDPSEKNRLSRYEIKPLKVMLQPAEVKTIHE